MNITWNLQKGKNINSLAHWGHAPALPFHQGMEAYKPTPLIILPKLAESIIMDTRN